MRMAARIRQIRLQSYLTLEDVAAKTGLAKILLARLEKGQDVPTLEMLDELAEALGVKVHEFFFDRYTDPNLTPRLMPRVGLEELARARPGRLQAKPRLPAERRIIAATVSRLLAQATQHLHVSPRRWRRQGLQAVPPASPPTGSAISEERLTDAGARDEKQQPDEMRGERAS